MNNSGGFIHYDTKMYEQSENSGDETSKSKVGKIVLNVKQLRQQMNPFEKGVNENNCVIQLGAQNVDFKELNSKLQDQIK